MQKFCVERTLHGSVAMEQPELDARDRSKVQRWRGASAAGSAPRMHPAIDDTTRQFPNWIGISCAQQWCVHSVDSADNCWYTFQYSIEPYSFTDVANAINAAKSTSQLLHRSSGTNSR